MKCLLTIWAILTAANRRAAVAVFLLMLVGTVLETVSIGLVVPSLAMLAGDPLAVPSFLRPLVSGVGSTPPPRTILLAMAAVVGIFAIKTVFMLASMTVASRYSQGVQAGTSQRLFAIFLAQPWSFHLQRNSATLLQAIGDAQHVSVVCTSIIQVLSEVLVLMALLALLFLMEPWGTAVVTITLGAAFMAFNTLLRPRVVGWAAARRHHAQSYVKHLQQALGGAKEVKVRGCEHEFLDRFSLHTDGIARMAMRQAVVEQVPRLWFELLAVIALFLLTAVMVWEGRSPQALVPMLGLFATVAFRLLPAINFSAITLQRIHQYEPGLAAIRGYLDLEVPAPAVAASRPATFTDAIRLAGVGYRYPGGHGAVLDGVDIVIPHGASVGVIGGSGAGKTTLIDVLLGLLPPGSGRVTVDGIDIHDDVRGWQRLIGYVPQTIYLCDESIRRNVAFGVPERSIDDAAVHQALAAARLADFVAGLPDGIETVVGERGARLSGGQRQRIGIARALYHNPELLVLDEATSSLDTETEREVMEAVEALHGVKTIVIVAHRLSTLSGCDLLYRLEGGRVVQSGTFAEIVPS
jgi:ABC-type multidrug transport system fused ATPase/permease subunit